jgi:hypothetical protein
MSEDTTEEALRRRLAAVKKVAAKARNDLTIARSAFNKARQDESNIDIADLGAAVSLAGSMCVLADLAVMMIEVGAE